MSSRLNKVNEFNEVTSVFCGINKGERIPDGYFSEIKNMTSSKYPCLATRAERKKSVYSADITAPGEPVDAITFNGGLMIACSNGMIMYGNKTVDGLTLTTDLVPYGNKVFCSPSMILIDKNFETFKNARLFYYQTFNVSVCDSSLNNIDKSAYSDEVPTSPTNGQLWYDTENKGLYKYSESQEEWVAVPQVYVKISSSDFDDFINFNEGDALSLVFSYDSDTYEMETFVSSIGSDYITVEGVLPKAEYIGNINVRIERKAPTLDYATAHNNRIWGCFYDGTINEIYASSLGDPLNWYAYRGLSTDSYAVSCGESGNFTGCTELGDAVVFFKENCIYTVYGTEPSNFQTVKTDCFGVQEGSEKSICKINGAVYYKSCHGIMRLSEGALPICISEDIGADIWSDAVAGTDGRKYYIVMTDINENREMFVFDTKYDLWHKEDVGCENLFAFATVGNNLLCVGKSATEQTAKEIRIPKITEDMAPKKEDYTLSSLYIMAKLLFDAVVLDFHLNIERKTDEEIRHLIAIRSETEVSEITDNEFEEFMSSYYERISTYKNNLNFSYISNELTCNAYLPVISGTYGNADEGRFHWECETGLRGLSFSDYKRLKGLEIRMKLSSGARCDIYIEYDGNGKWENIGSFDVEGTNTYRINDRLNICDVYRLRLRGYGQTVIYSIIETYEEAGTVGF